MADEKVTSWFMPQNLLDMMPADQAQAAASQARNTFMMGLLSGDIGAAYNNAQNQGYNTLAHANALQEALVKQQKEQLAQNIIKGAISPGVMPPVNQQTGQQMAGPWMQPEFDYNKIATNPYAPLVAERLKPIQEVFGPKPTVVNNRIVDTRDPANLNREFIKTPENMGSFGTDRFGNPIVGPLPGVVQATGALAGAKAAAENQFNLKEVFNEKTGKYEFMPATSIAAGAAAGQGFVSKRGEADVAAGTESGKAFDAYRNTINDRANTVTDRKTTAMLLSGLADKLDTNKFSEVKGQALQYLNAMGVTGDKAQNYASNFEAFKTFRQEKLKEQAKTFVGAQSEKELAAIMDMGQKITKPAEINKFYSATEIAQANRDEQIARANAEYNGPASRTAFQKYLREQPFMKNTVFADPVFKSMTIGGEPVQKIVTKGDKRYMLITPTKEVIELN